ncbi:Protein of unknown function [Gryllus bimaculatus]|nr:Protein of unknown function [Gryllus bimaculatus]
MAARGVSVSAAASAALWRGAGRPLLVATLALALALAAAQAQARSQQFARGQKVDTKWQSMISADVMRREISLPSADSERILGI